MGAGAKSEAIRLVESANQLIESADAGTVLDEMHRDRVVRALDHGLSRRVDHRIRQTHGLAPAWFELAVERVGSLAEADPGMVVVLGSHPNGHVREAAVRLARPWITPTDPTLTRKAPVGITRMLAQRALDPTPPVRAAAIELVAELFAHEMNPSYRGRMPTGVERAAREIVAQTRSVVLCPELVDSALDLFACRIGRYSIDGVRDHHQHTLQEVDRREQVLNELRRLLPDLTAPASIDAANRLVDFYQRSMRPVRAGDEGAVIDSPATHIPTP